MTPAAKPQRSVNRLKSDIRAEHQLRREFSLGLARVGLWVALGCIIVYLGITLGGSAQPTSPTQTTTLISSPLPPTRAMQDTQPISYDFTTVLPREKIDIDHVLTLEHQR
jgi:hypothetical protein